MRKRIILKYILPPLAIILLIPIFQKPWENAESFESDCLKCVISVKGRQGGMTYSAGYNYEMLKEFCDYAGKKAIILAGDKEYLDSLSIDSVDIVVLHYSDSLFDEKNYNYSIPLADSSAWLTNANKEGASKMINEWLASYTLTEDHNILVDRFSPSYNPFKRASSGKTYKTLSPYDHLFRKYAAALGWDWKMLTSLAWQESKFRIEVVSHRGASGMMQMMPVTIKHYQAGNQLDPEESISTSVKLLSRLQKMFADESADNTELIKFTLAAYNAGEGRIRDCINYAKSINAPHSRWDDIVKIISEMRDETAINSDSLRLGTFKGYETIGYIENFAKLYDAFCTIAPGQSSQDQPLKQRDTATSELPLSADTTLHQPQAPAKDRDESELMTQNNFQD